MSHHGNVHHIKGISQQTKHPLRVVKSMLNLFSILLHLLNCVCVCVFLKKEKEKEKKNG